MWGEAVGRPAAMTSGRDMGWNASLAVYSLCEISDHSPSLRLGFLIYKRKDIFSAFQSCFKH